MLTNDRMLILKVAKYYYLDECSQQEISEKVNIHRSQVSRLLKYAREAGYVRIDISLPDSENEEYLSRRLERLLGLRQVRISPSEHTATKDNHESFYLFATSFLEKELIYGNKVGIGWGKTLYNIALNLSQHSTPTPISFYSLTGLSGTSNPHLQINTITDRFAQCFHGKAFYNNFPSCIRLDRLSELDMQRLKELEENWSQIDTVVMSLGGNIQAAQPYMAELPPETDFQTLLNTAHGDIFAHFFFENEKTFQLSPTYMITSMRLDVLRKVPNVICVAAGSAKVSAIISAARQGYFNTLVTDDATARLILSAFTVED